MMITLRFIDLKLILSAMQYHQNTDEGIVLTMANQDPEGLLIFAFRPLSGKQKIKQVLCVLSVFAVKINIKTAPFRESSRHPF
jgi:hypothetical protein